MHEIPSRLQLLRQLLADFRLPTTLSNEDVTLVNLITLGPSGAGKSALINHLASALFGRYRRLVQVGLSTSALRKVELCFTESSDETLRLWDMPGWEHMDVRVGFLDVDLPSMPQIEVLDSVLRGHKVTGSELLIDLPGNDNIRRPTAADCVHGAFILLPFALQGDSSDGNQMMADAKKITKQLQVHSTCSILDNLRPHTHHL